jgi:hypothetical protein
MERRGEISITGCNGIKKMTVTGYVVVTFSIAGSLLPPTLLPPLAFGWKSSLSSCKKVQSKSRRRQHNDRTSPILFVQIFTQSQIISSVNDKGIRVTFSIYQGRLGPPAMPGEHWYQSGQFSRKFWKHLEWNPDTTALFLKNARYIFWTKIAESWKNLRIWIFEKLKIDNYLKIEINHPNMEVWAEILENT